MSKGIIYQHSFNIGHYYNRVEHLSSAAHQPWADFGRCSMKETNLCPWTLSWSLKTQLQWTMTVNEWLNTSHPFISDRPVSVGHMSAVQSNPDDLASYMLSGGARMPTERRFGDLEFDFLGSSALHITDYTKSSLTQLK